MRWEAIAVLGAVHGVGAQGGDVVALGDDVIDVGGALGGDVGALGGDVGCSGGRWRCSVTGRGHSAGREDESGGASAWPEL